MRTAGLILAIAALVGISTLVSAQYGYNADCEDAKHDAESAADDLASYASQLASCASSGDYSDDCSSELGSVTSAHYEYEAAVHDVDSYCE